MTTKPFDGMKEVDPDTAPPEQVVYVISHLIRRMGTGMMNRAVALEAANGGTDPGRVFHELNDRITNMTSRIVSAVEEDERSHDEPEGVTLLAVLQAAVWRMEKQFHNSPERVAQTNAALGMNQDQLLAEFPDEDTVDALPQGVLLRRKIRNDH